MGALHCCLSDFFCIAAGRHQEGFFTSTRLYPRTKAQSLAWPAQTLPDNVIQGYRDQILPLLQHDSGKKTHKSTIQRNSVKGIPTMEKSVQLLY
jgi:hypothetical protein